MTRELVVASWNVRECFPVDEQLYSDREWARAEICDLAERLHVDVLALQEVDFNDSVSSDTLSYLQENSPFLYTAHLALSPSSYFPGKMAGVVVASKTPIAQTTSGYFQNPRLSVARDGMHIYSHEKGFVAASLSTEDTSGIVVTSLHGLPFYLFNRRPEEDEFAPVWMSMSEQLEGLEAKYLIVCGDFNSPDRSPLLQLSHLNLVATNQDETYRGMTSDDILISRDIQVSHTQIVANFSDHAAYVASIQI